MPSPYYTAETFKATESIGFLVRRCATLMTSAGEAMLADADLPLTLTHWIVLMRLRDTPDLSASTLSGDIGHDLGSLTRVVDSLVVRKWVRRARNSADRRGVELRLTAAGRRLTDHVRPTMLASLNDLLSGFSARDARQLHRLLAQLMRILQARAADPQDPPAARAGGRLPKRRSARSATR